MLTYSYFYIYYVYNKSLNKGNVMKFSNKSLAVLSASCFLMACGGQNNTSPEGGNEQKKTNVISVDDRLSSPRQVGSNTELYVFQDSQVVCGITINTSFRNVAGGIDCKKVGHVSSQEKADETIKIGNNHTLHIIDNANKYILTNSSWRNVKADISMP